MRAVFYLVLTLLAAVSLARGADWALVQHEGREYISFENMAEFYGMKILSKDGKSCTMGVNGRSLRGETGSPDFFINNLKFILSYPAVEVGGKLCVSRMDLVKVIEPVLRPSKIANPSAVDTVILDPGHGGHDLGAQGGGGREKDFALDTANRAKLRLQQAGFKVYMTRYADVFIPLEERVAFANRFPNALFVSIHFNSSGNGTGIETYTLAPRGVPSMMADGPRVSDLQECRGNGRDAENMALATATHASLIVRSHLPDRGIKRARFVVIRDIAIPGVLIEGGFLSNPNDARLIAAAEYREQMAASIVEAALIYRRAVVGPNAPALVAQPELKVPELRDLAPIAAGPSVPPPAVPKKAAPPKPRVLSTDAAVAASAARVQITN